MDRCYCWQNIEFGNGVADRDAAMCWLTREIRQVCVLLCHASTVFASLSCHGIFPLASYVSPFEGVFVLKVA